jgi:hypothetical protein
MYTSAHEEDLLWSLPDIERHHKNAIKSGLPSCYKLSLPHLHTGTCHLSSQQDFPLNFLDYISSPLIVAQPVQLHLFSQKISN